MYKRILETPPENIIRDRKPVFGTFQGHPSLLDIRGVYRPIGVFPLPTFITNQRIKGHLSFFFTLGEYTGCIEFFDARYFGFAEVCFWNRSTKQRFSYRSLMGVRKRFIPYTLDKPSAVISFRKARYIKVSWDRTHNKFAVVFNLKGDSARPSVNGAFTAPMSSPECLDITSVTPSPTMRRCSAINLGSFPIHGTMGITSTDGTEKLQSNLDGCALFGIKQIYSRFRCKGSYLCGTGEIKGKRIEFYIAVSSQEAIDRDRYNDNVLFYDGKITTLPPVTITHNSGTMNKWNIQDTEGMIDMSFTPAAESMHQNSLFVIRTQYHTIFGDYEGVLLTSDGEKINLNKVSGIAKKYLLRL